MLRERTLALAAGLILLAAPLAAAAADIIHEVEFTAGMLTMETREGLDVVQVEGCRFELAPGRPMLPVRTLHLSVPAGMTATVTLSAAKSQNSKTICSPSGDQRGAQSYA